MIIKIVFLDDAGNETPDRIKGFPCIPVSYFYSENPHVAASISATNVWAGIDTGADFIYVDRTMAALHAAPIFHWSNVNNSDEKSSVHLGFVGFGYPLTTFRTPMVSRDFAGEGSPYRIMLGRHFFQFADLHFKPRDKAGCFIEFDADAIRAQGHFLTPSP